MCYTISSEAHQDTQTTGAGAAAHQRVRLTNETGVKITTPTHEEFGKRLGFGHHRKDSILWDHRCSWGLILRVVGTLFRPKGLSVRRRGGVAGGV